MEELSTQLRTAILREVARAAPENSNRQIGNAEQTNPILFSIVEIGSNALLAASV